jgi:outer membrane protein
VSADQAVQIALASNPDLIAITASGRAAGYDVSVAEASKLPTVSGIASGDYVKTIGGNGDVGGIPSSGTAT